MPKPEAAIFSEEGCFFELREGLFYVHDEALHTVRVMRPTAFMETIARAVECARQHRPWERASGDVIDFHAATGRSSK